MATAQDIITEALQTIGEVGQGETVNADDLSYCLTRLNSMIDSWSTERLSLYTVTRGQFTLTANTQDYTIGPTGTFATARPVLIQTASIIVVASIRNVMNLLTSKQWAAIPEKGLTGVLPTDLYMDQDYPDAGLHVWPIPSANIAMELYYWSALTQFASVSATLSMPPGYLDALKYGLMLNIASGYNKPLDPALVALAGQKKQAIQTINAQILGGSFGPSRTLHDANIGAIVPPVLTPDGKGGAPGPVNL